jgi:hypothetical protein
MNIVPAGIQAQINRVDRQWSLWIGVSLALVAAGSVFRLFWMLYISMAFGVFAGAMVVNIIFSLAFGAAAAIGAVGFLTRYHKDTQAERL